MVIVNVFMLFLFTSVHCNEKKVIYFAGAASSRNRTSDVNLKNVNKTVSNDKFFIISLFLFRLYFS